MQTTALDWLDRDVIACLEEKCGTLVDAVLIAYASESVGGELHSLGVRDLSSFGGANVYIPEGRERVVWARVVDYHGCLARQPQGEVRRQHAPRQRDGRCTRRSVGVLPISPMVGRAARRRTSCGTSSGSLAGLRPRSSALSITSTRRN